MKKRNSPPRSEKRRQGRLIMGKNCVKEVFENQPQRLLQVYTSRSVEKDSLLKKIQESNVPLKKVEKEELHTMVQTQSHQSIVARVKDTSFMDLKEFLKNSEAKEKSIVLMLDSIFDPQNFGALLRSCECFGVDAVIWSKNRGCDLTPVVSKASVGASELIPLIKVTNLAEAMRKFQEADYWSFTAEIGEGASKLTELTFPEKTLLIVGSEGKGVQNLLSRKADTKVYIPMYGKIDSLNVAQATSVLLYQWSLQAYV